ncbi:hypothetical protein TH53_12235 [Pedobacter lusitanus]|uniref:Contig52, whole genome shotgun sequence n=1 Tax=Pedobacter lusitanus TaxID=1503925 RepID=A0A0D0FWR2_9SPHI|nr:hypothetical protein TH53_12235 [Pedobacter lusitanus]
MTKTIITVLALSPGLAIAQSSFTLKAKVASPGQQKKAYLIYESAGKTIKDSSAIVNGAFQFTGKVEEPTAARLILDHKHEGIEKLKRSRNADFKRLYLDQGTIQLNTTDSVSKSKLSGSKINEEAEVYENYTDGEFTKTAKEVNAAFSKASATQKEDTTFGNALRERYNSASQQRLVLREKYVKDNPDSYFSLEALNDISGNGNSGKADSLFNGLSDRLKISPTGKDIEETIITARKTAVGAIAMDFTQNDVNDKPVKLSDFRGKYVLLDFWASWCGPCRGENPNVVKAFNAYKDKNFTVLGVSLDQQGKKSDWLKAIKDDGLAWTQVSDLQGWKNAASTLYGVRGIPANFLIDPQGKIVGKNLRGKELDKKLKELLGNGTL